MKLTPLALSLLAVAVAALTSGCKPATESTGTGTDTRDTGYSTTTSQPQQQVVDQNAPALKDYTYARKAELVSKMESQLTEIQRDLDELSAKIEKASDTAKAEAQPRFKALRDQTAALNKNLESVKSSTESTWEDVKTGAVNGYEELKVQFQQARQWVSDTIAP